MKLGHAFLLLAVSLLFTCSSALADAGYWRASGVVMNTDSNALGTQTCLVEGLKLRIKSRWADGQGCVVGFNGECPWGPSWGQDTTDAQGRFSEKSYHFADISKKRDILIEYRDVMNNTWRGLKVFSNISGATPHTKSGNVSNYDLGTITTDRFECPTEMQPGDDKKSPITTKPPSGQGPGSSKPQAQAICGAMGPDNQILRPDLLIVSSQVMPRTDQPGNPPERISWQVVIRNAGPGPYRATGKCRTRILTEIEIPEMDQNRVYDFVIPSLGVNESTTVTRDGNLGEISEASSTFYPITFTIDPGNNLPESNEANNSAQGCYNLSTESYTSGPCP